MSLESQVGGLAEAVNNLVRRFDDFTEETKERLNPLWNEYQQQKGERRIMRLWLGFLTLAITGYAAIHH
jgi:hypothetical protein